MPDSASGEASTVGADSSRPEGSGGLLAAFFLWRRLLESGADKFGDLQYDGAFSLPQPLQARARNAANTGTAYNNVGSSASPLNLLTYGGPVSNDQVSLQFSQLINSGDALRTGAYSKTLTFTLSTTNP